VICKWEVCSLAAIRDIPDSCSTFPSKTPNRCFLSPISLFPSRFEVAEATSGRAGRAYGSGSVLDGPRGREWWGVPPGDAICVNVSLSESSGLRESISQ